tara:strand:+ start:414 stop:1103 length:690 start_codon:yes stop_codon:yes gene_type:complete
MAEGKKSFIAYSDWYGTFRALPDDIAGQLIKYIFSYVNDEEPQPHENYIVNALFEQVKATLKRDLNKWDKQREQRSEAGKKSAELRATKSNERSIPFNEKVRNPTVSVNGNVNVSVKEINNKKVDSNESCFNIFWSKYPNKVAKDKCKTKFLKLPQVDIDKILATVDAYVNYKPFKEYNHPNPETYLNQKRWNDEIEVKTITNKVTIYDPFVEHMRKENEKYKHLNEKK